MEFSRKIKEGLIVLLSSGLILSGCSATTNQNNFPEKYRIYDPPITCKEAIDFYEWKLDDAIKEVNIYVDIAGRVKKEIDSITEGKPDDYFLSRRESRAIGFYGLVVIQIVDEMTNLKKNIDELETYTKRICEKEQR